MTGPIDPKPADPTPADDPGGFLVGLLGRYLPPGYVESLIRTWVPVGIGTAITWLLSWVAAHWHWHIVLSQHASTTVGIVSVGVVTSAYYGLGRFVERRWPVAGKWLLALNLVKSRPVYAGRHDAVRLVNARTGTVRREDPDRRG